MTYNELRALARQVKHSDDNLFRESSVVARTGLESAILENNIDKHLSILKEKMNKSYCDSEDIFFFHESINRCLDEIDNFLNDTVAKVPLYRENKINAFFKNVYLYLKAIWDKIKKMFFGFIAKFKKDKAYKGGEKVTPDAEVEKKVNKEFRDAVDAHMEDDGLDDIFERTFGNGNTDTLSEEDVKSILSEVTEAQKKSGEIVFAKNIYEKVYASAIDIDAKRLMLGELMNTYDLKQLSKSLIDFVKSHPSLKGDLSKYVKVLKLAKDSDDTGASRAILGNMLLELVSTIVFADGTTHKVNFFDVEIARFDHAFSKAEKKFSQKGSYAINRALDTLFGDKADNGDVAFSLVAVLEELNKVVEDGDKDYIRPMRVPIQYFEGMYASLPDEDTLNKWYSMCSDIMNVDLNEWYGSQLGLMRSIGDGLAKYNKVVTGKPVSAMANELIKDKGALANLKADYTWGDTFSDLLGKSVVKGLAPSKLEKVDKSRIVGKDGNFDLYNKAVTYSELLNIIQVTDENMYNKVPKSLKSLVKDSSAGIDTSVLDETIKRATSLFQVRLADPDAMDANVAKRVKDSITNRTSTVKEFMQAVTNYMKVAEMRRINYRQVMTSFLEVYTADLGIKQYGVLTVIEYILSDKFLLDTAITEILGASK